MLVILFVFGMTLEGASNGIMFYVKPDFQKLLNVDVWIAAATQIFYSLGPAFGALVTLSSYNRFDNNCHRDALIVAFLNCGTSVFAGFVVFSIVGFMANRAGKPVGEMVASGPALAFVAYPEAFAEMGDQFPMPVPQIMSFLFFLMLITLGLDSMFTYVETIITCIMDHFQKLIPYKSCVVVSVCLVGFTFGLSMCTSGGIFMFELI